MARYKSKPAAGEKNASRSTTPQGNSPRRTGKQAQKGNVAGIRRPGRPDIDPAKPPRRKPARNRLPEKTGSLLVSSADQDYALLDSGNGQKLERYGRLKIVRPEAQAIWQPALPESAWRDADAMFTGDTDEEGLGRWQFPKGDLAETFAMKWDGISYWGRFTSFRHTGVFPEQAVHWRDMINRLETAKLDRSDQPKVLNLFGYTGIATLAAARAGAMVTHVDASKKAIGWARENQRYAGMEEKPIRWICEDAVRFCEREVRRGNKYDGILLDPPAYGRGPKGEVWQIFDDLPHLLDLCRELISPNAMFTVLTAYAIRASYMSMHELMQEVYGDCGGLLESGELAICTENSNRHLSTSMFSRWTSDA